MELQTIGQISKKYGISIQTLRYYEQIGLIESTRNNDNAYRFYDEAVIKQLHTIILLRKLRISLKQIKEILNNQNAATIVGIFEQNISELDEEITSLSIIKSILTQFAEELRAKTDMVLQLDLLNNTSAFSIIDSLSFSKNYINSIKENFTMEDLNKANEILNKLKRSDVRIIYVPPMTIAVHGSYGDEEKAVGEKFIRESELLKMKPDVRLFTVFNCSIEDLKDLDIQSDEGWVSIPDDMEVPTPFTKKTFEGGLYAAYSGNESVEGFRSLAEWVNESEKYEIADGRPLFDECLNAYHLLNGDLKKGTGELQGDLLLPIKKIAE